MVANSRSELTMTTALRVLLGHVLAGATCAILGCTANPESLTSDVDVDIDVETVAERDLGTSYDGWSVYASGTNWRAYGYAELSVGFFKYGGDDDSRGGGGCLVRRVVGASCSVDADCPKGHANGWGYCFYGACWQRAESQASWCALGPAQAHDSSVPMTVPVDLYNTDEWGILTCLTKTAGPNAACGGTDSSLYMRWVTHMDNGS
jgi:hypothetical protein